MGKASEFFWANYRNCHLSCASLKGNGPWPLLTMSFLKKDHPVSLHFWVDPAQRSWPQTSTCQQICSAPLPDLSRMLVAGTTATFSNRCSNRLQKHSSHIVLSKRLERRIILSYLPFLSSSCSCFPLLARMEHIYKNCLDILVC